MTALTKIMSDGRTDTILIKEPKATFKMQGRISRRMPTARLIL